MLFSFKMNCGIYLWDTCEGRVKMETQRIKEHTIDDIYALPEEKRAELIDGRIYYQAAPSGEHQMILSELLQDIESISGITAGNARSSRLRLRFI